MNGVFRNYLAVAVVLASLSCHDITAPTGRATHLLLATQSTSAESGVPFATQPVVMLLGADKRVVGFGAPVTAAISSGNGTLVGATEVIAVDGVAKFTDLRIDGAGLHTVTFTAAGMTPVKSGKVMVTQTPAALLLEEQPEGAETGLTLKTQPVVLVLDRAGLVITTSSLAVTASIFTGSGTLSGTTTMTPDRGVVRFLDLAIEGAGAHSLAFTAAGVSPPTPSLAAHAPPPVPATSNDFLVLGATHVELVQEPDTAIMNAPFMQQPIVELRGADGTLMTGSQSSVTATVGSGDGTLMGTTTVNAAHGVATFTDLRLTRAGPHTLVFTAETFEPAASDTFNVAAVAVALAMATEPGGAVSGRDFTTQPVVSVRDEANAVVPGATVPVTASLASGTGTLRGTLTVNASGGVATFTNLRVDGVGPHTLTFTSPSLVSATSASVVVTQRPARVAVETQPVGALSDQPLTTQPAVRILDHALLPINDATVPVTAAIASGSGTLVGTTTVNAASGLASFTDLRVEGGGPHTLRFTSPGLSSTTSNSFSIGQTATALAVQTQPGGATAELFFATQPVIQVRDLVNAVVVGSTAPVTATIASGPGTLSGTTTVSAVNGVASFTDLRLDTPGSYRVSFATPNLPTATSASFTVSQAPALLAMQTEPNGAVSGRNFTTQPVVSVRDGANDLAGGSTAPVTVSLASGTGMLIGTTMVSAVGGVATFTNVRVDGVGPHSLTFTSPSLAAATSASVAVTQTPAGLVVETQPIGAASDQPLTTQPVVRILDLADLPINDATVPVTAAFGSGSGTLVGTVTVNAVGGLATFTDLRVEGGGPHTLTFTSSAVASATSNSFEIGQTAAALAIQAQPGGATTGLSFTTQPVVHVRDLVNAVVIESTAPVTATIASGPGTLAGTTTVSAVNGVASFTDLRLDAPGSYTVSFASPGLPTVGSASFTVSQVPVSVAMQRQPNGAVSGTPLTTQPGVWILDHAGQPIGNAASAVTVALASGSGTLVGALTVNVVNGVATFTNLRIDGAGPHTLRFSSPGLVADSSNTVNVTQVAAALFVQTQPGGATTGMAFTAQPAVQIRDQAGLPIAGATNVVSASIASGSGSLSGTASVAAMNGVARFTNLAITGTGVHTLRFASGAFETISAGFLVSGSSSFPLHPSCVEYATPTVPAPLRTFYVNGTSGNDVSSGTSPATAWRTLAKANGLVQPGDLILLRGVFSGQAIRPQVNGTAAAKIVYRVMPNDSARITLGASGVAIRLEFNAHIVVDGIEINNVATPFRLRGAGTNWLRNINIHDAGGSVITNSDDNRVESSTFARIGTQGSNVSDALLIEDGADRNIIVRNTVGHAGHGTIWVGSGSTALAIVNDNVIAQNDTHNPWAAGMGLGTRAARTIVECNRIRAAASAFGANPARSGLDVGGVDNIIRYNEIYQNGAFGITTNGRTYSTTPVPVVANQFLENTLWGNLIGAIQVVLTLLP